MKDSGNRDRYIGGAQRDAREGKGRFDLVSPIALTRLARVYEEGAKGKGERNWEQGVTGRVFRLVPYSRAACSQKGPLQGAGVL